MNDLLTNRRIPVPVAVPEWDRTIHLLPLGLQGLLELERAQGESTEQRARMTATLLVLHITDEHGNRLLRDDQVQELLDTQPASVLTNLFARLAEISPRVAPEKNSRTAP